MIKLRYEKFIEIFGKSEISFVDFDRVMKNRKSLFNDYNAGAYAARHVMCLDYEFLEDMYMCEYENIFNTLEYISKEIDIEASIIYWILFTEIYLGEEGYVVKLASKGLKSSYSCKTRGNYKLHNLVIQIMYFTKDSVTESSYFIRKIDFEVDNPINNPEFMKSKLCKYRTDSGFYAEHDKIVMFRYLKEIKTIVTFTSTRRLPVMYLIDHTINKYTLIISDRNGFLDIDRCMLDHKNGFALVKRLKGKFNSDIDIKSYRLYDYSGFNILNCLQDGKHRLLLSKNPPELNRGFSQEVIYLL